MSIWLPAICLTKAGSVAQAVPTTDGLTSYAGITTRRQLTCGEDPPHVVRSYRSDATVLDDYALTTTRPCGLWRPRLGETGSRIMVASMAMDSGLLEHVACTVSWEISATCSHNIYTRYRAIAGRTARCRCTFHQHRHHHRHHHHLILKHKKWVSRIEFYHGIVRFLFHSTHFLLVFVCRPQWIICQKVTSTRKNQSDRIVNAYK